MSVRGGIDPCGSGDRARDPLTRALLATLCRFDDKLGPKPLLGPFIPWERRLAKVEILEIQGRGFQRPF